MPRNTAQQLYDVGYVVYWRGGGEAGGEEVEEKTEKQKNPTKRNKNKGGLVGEKVRTDRGTKREGGGKRKKNNQRL